MWWQAWGTADMVRARLMVTCPCCKGKKRLALIEHDEVEGRTILTHPICCHCQGKGEVPAENLDEVDQFWQP